MTQLKMLTAFQYVPPTGTDLTKVPSNLLLRRLQRTTYGKDPMMFFMKRMTSKADQPTPRNLGVHQGLGIIRQIPSKLVNVTGLQALSCPGARREFRTLGRLEGLIRGTHSQPYPEQACIAYAYRIQDKKRDILTCQGLIRVLQIAVAYILTAI